MDNVSPSSPPESGGLRDVPPDSGELKSLSDRDTESNSLSVREVLGSGSAGLSDLVNENLTAFRLGGKVAMGAVIIYGLSLTPPFARYKALSSIPGEMFARRSVLRGRLVPMNTASASNDSILLGFVHQSHFERLFLNAQPLFSFLRIEGVHGLYKPADPMIIRELLSFQHSLCCQRWLLVFTFARADRQFPPHTYYSLHVRAS